MSFQKPQLLDFQGYLSEGQKPKNVHDFGCAMLYYDFPKMKELHECIEEGDIYTEENDDSYGLEDEPHVTLLYGLHDGVDDEHVREICMSHKFENLLLENISSFENEKYDVLKFDVKGKGLHECNSKLANLPHTNDYPNYHPHSTIAYLKPGKSKGYIEKLKGASHQISPKMIVYSKPSGEKSKWKL